jgi:hypothetical protein
LSGAHLLIWADDQPDQGRWHMPFKLDKGGEELAIFHKTDTIFLLIDSLTLDPRHPIYHTVEFRMAELIGQACHPRPAQPTQRTQSGKTSQPTEFTVYQNYPNPFNGRTKSPIIYRNPLSWKLPLWILPGELSENALR